MTAEPRHPVETRRITVEQGEITLRYTETEPGRWAVEATSASGNGLIALPDTYLSSAEVLMHCAHATTAGRPS